MAPVRKEKDLGVEIKKDLTWEKHISAVVGKANKMFGLLRRTCPLIKDTKIRRSFYLSLVKCHLNYATEVWSPAHISLKLKIESVQGRASRWILQQRKGEQEYKDRLVALDLLPLCYDREMTDLMFFYKAFYGYIDIHICNFVSFVNNGRTRPSQLRTLKTPFCQTSIFQSSYFNRIVKLWNRTIHVIPEKNFSSLLLFKRAINDMYKSVLNRSFDLSMPCTLNFVPDCSCHSLSSNRHCGLSNRSD